MDIFLGSKSYNQYLFRYVLIISYVFQKLFLMLYKYKILFASMKLPTNFENAYWNPPQNSLFCDWSMVSNVNPSLAAMKIAQNIFFTDGFRNVFTGSQESSCMHFQDKNPRRLGS
jgi:hypothetical protein